MIRVKKTGNNIVLGIIIIVFGIPTLISVFDSLPSGSNNDEVAVADGFTINSYNVNLNVKEDNVVNVTEDIEVNWDEEYHHGILKFIPEWLKYTGQDGKTIQRKSIVSNLEAVDEEFFLDEVKDKKRIKIGDPYNYVELGPKDYTIKYDYNMGKDPFNGFDEFIFHAYGDYWGTELKDASLNVVMPKSIEGAKIRFFEDKKRESDITDCVDYTIEDGNVIKAKLNSYKYYSFKEKEYCGMLGGCDEDDYASFENLYYTPFDTSLTVDIELPEGYFVGGSFNYGWFSFILCLIVFGITLWTIIKWFKYGKDLPNVVQTIEFYPPEGFNSAEIGYIYGNHSYKKLTISLLIQLASKGYLKIDNTDDKKIRITGLCIKPAEIGTLEDFIPKRSIKINKLREVDDSLDKNSQKMMKKLFSTRNTKTLRSNYDEFDKVSKTLVEGGYIQIVIDNKAEIDGEMDKNKSLYEEAVNQYNNDIAIYNEKVKNLKPLSFEEQAIIDLLFADEDEIILSEHKTFYKSFDTVKSALKNNTRFEVIDKKSNTKMLTSILLTILVLVISIYNYCFVSDMTPTLSILYYISFASIPINLLFTIIMRRKTQKGEDLVAKIGGFKDFLLKAEKEKLEALVEQYPSYFYDILPYTYVLGISKVWIKKFEDIPMTEFDMGNFDYSSDSAYYDMYTDVYTPSSSGSSSGGCSSCGGGCSSCGGGCSSCGGGGSW